MKKILVHFSLWLLKLAKTNEEAKHIVLTEATKHLFNTVSSEDILKLNLDGSIQFEDKTLPASYKKDLQEQAKLLPNLLLWRIIQKDIQYQLNKKMYQESQITQDLLWGKLILWINDVIKTRINQFTK